MTMYTLNVRTHAVRLFVAALLSTLTGCGSDGDVGEGSAGTGNGGACEYKESGTTFAQCSDDVVPDHVRRGRILKRHRRPATEIDAGRTRRRRIARRERTTGGDRDGDRQDRTPTQP